MNPYQMNSPREHGHMTAINRAFDMGYKRFFLNRMIEKTCFFIRVLA